MSNWERVGRKCICITSFWQDRGIDGPGKGEEVTISETYVNAGGLLTLRFVEHFGWLDENMGCRHGYSPSRFRPVHTLRSDVRAIKAIVREMPASERLDRLAELLNE